MSIQSVSKVERKINNNRKELKKIMERKELEIELEKKNKIIDDMEQFLKDRYKLCKEEEKVANENRDYSGEDLWKYEAIATEICLNELKAIIRRTYQKSKKKQKKSPQKGLNTEINETKAEEKGKESN